MRGNRFVLVIASLIVAVILGFPCFSILWKQAPISQDTMSDSSLSIIIQTIAWACVIGLFATVIGWPLGIKIPTLSKRMRHLIYTTLALTLAIPAYAVYYAWWQAWPAGTAIHDFIVHHDMLSAATKCTLALSLIGWSWPIAALIAASCVSQNDSMRLLHRIDGAALHQRIIHHVRVHYSILIASCVLIASITASNTTCFDLAQVSTISNELRAVIGAGGSIADAPLLAWSSLFFAFVGAIAIISLASQSKQVSIKPKHKSPLSIIIVWIVLSGGPIVLGSLNASGVDSSLLFSQYGGDLLRSVTTSMMSASGCLIVLVVSALLHASVSSKTRTVANILDLLWICAALLPATLLAEAETMAWNQPFVDSIYRSPLLVVFAQIAHLGFIASLAGRWVAKERSLNLLLSCDAPRSILLVLEVLSKRLFASAVVVVAVTVAMSMGEVAMTTQLSPPSTDQPIAIALLNAMHYQRPQIVTATMLFLVSFAAVAGIVVGLCTKRITPSLLLCLCLLGCVHDPQQSEQDQLIPLAIIGGAGKGDGLFITPRAADHAAGVTVVIDKSSRLQRFDCDGKFLSSWSLPPTGNGFPTGVTIDDKSFIWIADTHGHRVRVLDANGSEILRFGEYGTEDGQFLYPTDIAFGKNGLVYVSEYGGNDRISVFDRGGNFLHSFGHHGKETGAFRRPQSIALHPNSGLLYITDSANHRIVVYDEDGTHLRTFGSIGQEKGELLYPYGIVVLSDGSLLVTEFGNNRLQQFTEAGESIGVFGGAGDNDGFFKTPWGAVVLDDGVLVIDTGNNRLQLLDAFMMPQS
ncbi:MAG: hypothetical protein QGF07_02190 [Phycisphaerales bacterium]|nr:hypothetical protein [Phycisphaerales bacterium]